MQVDRNALLEEVIWRGAISDHARAEAAVEAALEALAAHLAPADARAIASELPASFARALDRRTPSAPAHPDDLYARIAADEAISLGLAVEHARAACTAIADALDNEQRSRLARRLPPEWSALFMAPPRASEAETSHGTLPGHGHTLATGRPGSHHPLSEGSVRAAQPNSVVSDDNPHADSKLSSAEDPASGDRLATGKPGPKRSIADAKDEG